VRESKVILVGAGPGDPELISVKGLKAIQAADVILYDALSSEELLSEASDSAELIYVGKRCTSGHQRTDLSESQASQNSCSTQRWRSIHIWSRT